MELVDTHCHIHDEQYGYDLDQVFKATKANQVTKLIVIGTSALDSQKAVQFAKEHTGCYASIGLHPHDAKQGEDDFELLTNLVSDPKVVAIGEFGLDYFYDNSPKEDQMLALRYQLNLAVSSSKPCIFHVREAFTDFWPVFDEFPGIKGVIHSFTGTKEELDEALKRNLYIGLNGIMTFTKKEDQLEMAKAVPLSKLLLETDAPYLTPAPFRGKMNEPGNVRIVADFLSRLRGESIETLSEVTTGNARSLFGI